MGCRCVRACVHAPNLKCPFAAFVFFGFFFTFQMEDEEAKALRLAEFWALYTTDENPQQKKSARCRHCGDFYNHHKQSEQAKLHLTFGK